MDRFSIGARVFSGFGAVLALLLVLAGVGFGGAAFLGSIFTEYRTAARQTMTVGNFVEDLFEARIAAFKYRIAPSGENAKEVESNIAEIQRDVQKAEMLFAPEDPNRDTIRQLAGETTAYRDAFQKMQDFQAERETLVATLVKLGPKARKQLTDVMRSAYEDGDPRAAYYASLVQENLLLGRFYTERYLLTNAADALTQSKQFLGEARRQSADLLAELQNPERRRLATATQADIDRYATTVAELSRVISARNDIRSNTLDRLGPKMQDAYDQMLESIATLQNRLGPEGAAASTWTRVFVAGVAVVALALGAMLALFIARSLTRSVNATAKEMDLLAKGDLDIAITGDEHDHELGRMARALRVFKDNAKEVRTMTADKEEAERVAEAAREAMTRALSSVVDAAVDGDFSQRMSGDFPDPAHREIAKGVNAMLDAVDMGVSETERVVSNLAQGDLGDRMRGDFKGAFASLQRGVNGTFERLSDLIVEIVETSQSIQSGAGVISAGAGQLSASAEQQASSLQETAATMEEMSATVRNNAENATNARALAGDASQQANVGGGVVKDAVTAMSNIEAGAAKITDIIAVIDGIAFQTNLLALNAAVEAARAGDAGKGFAVVASEVRTLAQRSSDAAGDIRSLIEESNDQVSDGVRLVSQAGVSLTGIVEAVSEVEKSISAIAEAGAEQATGVSEVTDAVGHMDGMTQKNATMASESAANSRSLTKQADRLLELVAFFKTDQAATHRAA